MTVLIVVAYICALSAYFAIGGVTSYLIYAYTQADLTEAGGAGVIWPLTGLFYLCKLPWLLTNSYLTKRKKARDDAEKLAQARVVQR